MSLSDLLQGCSNKSVLFISRLSLLTSVRYINFGFDTTTLSHSRIGIWKRYNCRLVIFLLLCVDVLVT